MNLGEYLDAILKIMERKGGAHLAYKKSGQWILQLGEGATPEEAVANLLPEYWAKPDHGTKVEYIQGGFVVTIGYNGLHEHWTLRVYDTYGVLTDGSTTGGTEPTLPELEDARQEATRLIDSYNELANYEPSTVTGER